MSKFLKRTIITVTLILFILADIYLFPSWLFSLITLVFIALGLCEFFDMVEKKDIFVYKYFGTVFGCLIPIFVFMGYMIPGIRAFGPLLIVVASILAFTSQLARRDDTHDHLLSVALTLFSVFYISGFFSFFIKIKFMENGANLVAFLVLVTKSSDIGAYVIGSRFGKTKLIPRISPKKTREGTIGGLFVSIICAVLLGQVLTDFSYVHLVILGILLAVLGQTGDLFESLIKRDCGVKDSGNILPGIGGVLDLIDSLLFTAPIFYFYIKVFLI